jgi:hypothetical protein
MALHENSARHRCHLNCPLFSESSVLSIMSLKAPVLDSLHGLPRSSQIETSDVIRDAATIGTTNPKAHALANCCGRESTATDDPQIVFAGGRWSELWANRLLPAVTPASEALHTTVTRDISARQSFDAATVCLHAADHAPALRSRSSLEMVQAYQELDFADNDDGSFLTGTYPSSHTRQLWVGR